MTTLTERLPQRVLRAAEVRALERAAIERCGVTDYELMCRAGAEALRVLKRRWPAARSIAVVCGAGNNAGDGLVLARLAHAAGLAVTVLLVVPAERFTGAAAAAAEAYRAAGLPFAAFDALALANVDVIVDGLLGIGLAREVRGEFAAAIDAINAAGSPVLALDVPSGLDADTGWPYPIAVRAAATLTFLALKPGLFLGAAPDHCGELEFAGLDVPAEVGADLPAALQRLTFADLQRALPPRARSAHKGSSGKLLLVGGGPGMPGAIRLAAEAALRVGAGLVYVATHPESAGSVVAGRPEIICRSVTSGDDLDPLLETVDGVVLGPGLGQSAWGYGLWRRVMAAPVPLVLDADGLNLLARDPQRRSAWLLTPHPGEAARLLSAESVESVQRDRAAAVRALADRYGAVAVLKGPNTLIASPGAAEPPAVCDRGNPGMATGGTGDVLAGVLGSLLVQTRDLTQAARAGVLLHALAGDDVARDGQRGTLPSDLFPQLRAWANPS